MKLTDEERQEVKEALLEIVRRGRKSYMQGEMIAAIEAAKLLLKEGMIC